MSVDYERTLLRLFAQHGYNTVVDDAKASGTVITTSINSVIVSNQGEGCLECLGMYLPDNMLADLNSAQHFDLTMSYRTGACAGVCLATAKEIDQSTKLTISANHRFGIEDKRETNRRIVDAVFEEVARLEDPVWKTLTTTDLQRNPRFS